MKMKSRLFLILFVFLCGTAHAFEQGDWLIRLRGIAVIPNDQSGSLNTIPHSGVKVSDSGTAELDFTYMCSNNIGVELILATTKHNINGKKALDGIKVGSTWVLPPTLLLQYHFFSDCCFQPYVGAGVNYTCFYNNHSSLESTRLSLSNSWGGAVQVGCDYLITDHWFANIDFKYITMNTTAHLKGATMGKVHVRLNPFIIGGGIGYRF